MKQIYTTKAINMKFKKKNKNAKWFKYQKENLFFMSLIKEAELERLGGYYE